MNKIISKETFPCRVYDVDENLIYADCIVDIKNSIIEKRKFDRKIFSATEEQLKSFPYFNMQIENLKNEINIKFLFVHNDLLQEFICKNHFLNLDKKIELMFENLKKAN